MKFNYSEIVLYEDNHIIVVHKPANLLSQADNTKDIDLVTLTKAYLKIKYNKPNNVYVGLVHRLDRMTEGVMVLAKTSKAASRLSEDIRENKLNKKYLALTYGVIEKSSRLTDYVRHIDNTKKMEVCKPGSGQLAELSFEVLKIIKDKTLVHVDLITGRHHQIRVQFSKFGHPLVGDLLYGPNKKCDLMLCCCELTLIHPTLKTPMTFKSLPRSKKWDKIIKDQDLKNSICL